MKTRLRLVVLLMAALAVVAFAALAMAETAGQAAHGQAVEGHGAEAGSHEGVSPALMSDFYKRLLNFTVMVAVLVFLLRKPLKQFFGGRREEIARLLTELEESQAEADQRYKALEARLADAQKTKDEIIADYLKEGEVEKEKIIAAARQVAEHIQTQATLAIDQEIAAAKAGLKREIAEMSSKVAEDMIKRSISDDDQKRLVNEYLEKVVEH